MLPTFQNHLIRRGVQLGGLSAGGEVEDVPVHEAGGVEVPLRHSAVQGDGEEAEFLPRLRADPSDLQGREAVGVTGRAEMAVAIASITLTYFIVAV